jgi:hypothetical protein
MFKKAEPSIIIVGFILIGQLIFAGFSEQFVEPYYQSRFFATTSVKFDGVDLHKLNEGAHYFAQTMIGWTKFPSFRHQLITLADLPADADINLRMQERQNIIFTLSTSEPVSFEALKISKDFLQSKIDEYNENSNTAFLLSNVDYEQTEVTRSYSFGSAVTLALSLSVAFAVLFIKREFFRPKLRLFG